MSATLDGARVAKLLGDAPIDPQRRPPPSHRHALRPAARERAHRTKRRERRPPRARRNRRRHPGLPPRRSAKSAASKRCSKNDGIATSAALRRAARRSARPRHPPAQAGTRKIVLATAIAETSLTIEDVRVVIDSGLQRLPRYDPATGLTRLVTQRVSLASADQRRGRAGRVAPGVCYRLWDEAETRALIPFTPPEILTSDLAPFALDLAAWGERDASSLKLLDPPPAGTFAEAQELCANSTPSTPRTASPRTAARWSTFGAHPRLAHMMLRARDMTPAPAPPRSPPSSANATSSARRDADLRRASKPSPATTSATVDRGALARAREQARVWRRTLDVKDANIDTNAAGRLAALAYPERIAKRRGPGSFRLANGRGATLPETDPLARARLSRRSPPSTAPAPTRASIKRHR